VGYIEISGLEGIEGETCVGLTEGPLDGCRDGISDGASEVRTLGRREEFLLGTDEGNVVGNLMRDLPILQDILHVRGHI